MSDSQEHFDDGIWLDFVRKLTSAVQTARVQQHLDAGCPECLMAYVRWSGVLEFAERESKYIPPEEVVVSVKAAFLLSREFQVRSRVAQVARLIFDSIPQPLAAGVRGGFTSARHLSYKSGALLVDLRLERESVSRVSMAGQVLHADRGAEATAAAGAALVQGEDRLVGQTIANSLGEFQLDFDRQKDLRLYLDVPEVELTVIVLPSLDDSPAPH